MTDTAKTYGGALYDLAVSEDLTERLLDELDAVRGAFSQHDGYAKLLSNPAIAKPERRALIDEAWKDAAHPYVVNFMKLLCDNGTISQFSDCVTEYRRRYNADHGILTVRAVSAVPLREDLAQKLREKIARMTGKAIELTTCVDESILGGVRLELAGRELDGSVQYHLDALSKKLRSADLQAAQSACDQ